MVVLDAIAQKWVVINVVLTQIRLNGNLDSSSRILSKIKGLWFALAEISI